MRLDDAKKRREFEAFVREIMSLPPERVLELLGELEVPEPFRLRMKVLYSRVPPGETFGKDIPLGRVRAAFPNNDLSFETDLSVGRTTQRRIRIPFTFVSAREHGIYVAIAICARDEWIALLRLLEGQYPRLVPIFLSQRELITSVKTLRRDTQDLALRVREMSAVEPIDGESRRRRKSVREWTDEDLDKMLAHVEDRRQLISSMRFDFYRRLGDRIDVTPALSCKVTRGSVVEISGRFAIAWSTVIADIARAGSKKLSFFSRRGLRDRDYTPAPLAITFKRDVFTELVEVRRLVEALRRYPNSSHAVVHGNPYAYVEVADRYDGSSFDVWAVSPERILLIPRLRATEAAVERLVHYIYENFREGEIVDAVA